MPKARTLAANATRCPKCRSRLIAEVPPLPEGIDARFYGTALRACRRCKSVWEAEPERQDPDDPVAWREPCDNCAFRPGSPETADPAGWRTLLAQLKAGSPFYCHKGVPIDPGSEHGFAYPLDRPGKMRMCRGFLNAVAAWERDGDYRWLNARFGIAGDPAETSDE